MTQICLFKLVTSEEVIARVVTENGDHTIIEKARAVHVIPAPDGRSYQVALVPFSPAVPDGEIIIYHTGLVGQVVEDKIPNDFLKSYMQQTSGIDIVSSTNW